MEKVRFGIIGFGNMGSGHAENLTAGKIENGVLAAICDIKPGKLEYAKEKYPNVLLFDNHTELLKSGLVDAVIIATPHVAHPPIGIDAMRAGIAVMSEKPAGVYTKQVEEIIAVQKETGVPYGVMFNQRTNPVYKKMRELVQSGELGTITRCSWLITDWYRTQNYYDSGDWRATWSGEGGGVLNAFADHLVKGTPMIAEGYEGINGVAIANAMMLSSWKNDFVECKNDGEKFWAELQKRIATSRRNENVAEDKIADLSDTYNSKTK